MTKLTPTQAIAECRDRMNDHGLTDWVCRIDRRSKSRGGVCRYRSKTIEISQWYVFHATDAEVRNTILHEIAHALAGYEAKHGPEWKKIARSIGCTGDRCHTVQNLDAKYVDSSCPCGIVHTLHRKVSTKYVCRKTGYLLFQPRAPQLIPNLFNL